jgi:hypothetical protein
MSFIPTISVLTSVYRGEEYLRAFFENLSAQTIFPELELILVLNDPTPIEHQLAREFSAQHKEAVQLLSVAKPETLGASWNRAWRTARAPYLAIWNVDDRRVVDSLQRQLTMLEQEPAAVLTYGDYVTVKTYGGQVGVRRHTPQYQVGHFRRAFAQGGAFWVFRKPVESQAGYFDEQFHVGADMEYSFRLAAKGLAMVRSRGLLGYFTDAAQGLSTRQGAKESEVEATSILLRYGVYDKVRREYLSEACKLRLNVIRSGDEWIQLTDILPDHSDYLKKREPLWVLGVVRHALRSVLQRVGLLAWLHKLQAKYIKRDL